MIQSVRFKIDFYLRHITLPLNVVCTWFADQLQRLWGGSSQRSRCSNTPDVKLLLYERDDLPFKKGLEYRSVEMSEGQSGRMGYFAHR